MERKASMLAQRGKVGEQTAKAGSHPSEVVRFFLEVVEVEFPPQVLHPWKFNSLPLKIGRAPKGKDHLPVPSFFRGELLNFGGVVGGLVVSNDVFFSYMLFTQRFCGNDLS